MPRSFDRSIEINPDERMFLAGKTKSGKSTLTRYLTRAVDRLVLFDPKVELEDWGLAAWDAESRKALREGAPIRTRVLWEEGPSADWWDSVMWEILEAGDLTLVIDEVLSLAPSSGWAPESLQRIWTQGRHYGIRAFACSQRPRRIPAFLLTEAEHFAAFRLQRRDDRIYMGEYMGEEVEDRIPAADRHGFWYYYNEEDRPIYVPALDLGEGDPWRAVEERLEA